MLSLVNVAFESMMVMDGCSPEFGDCCSSICILDTSGITTYRYELVITVYSKHESHCVMVEMLRDRFMIRRTSTSGRLSCLVWPQPSSAAAMCKSKRSDTDFFLSLGFPLKKEPSHCFITLSILSVLRADCDKKRSRSHLLHRMFEQ